MINVVIDAYRNELKSLEPSPVYLKKIKNKNKNYISLVLQTLNDIILYYHYHYPLHAVDRHPPPLHLRGINPEGVHAWQYVGYSFAAFKWRLYVAFY